MIRGLLYRSLLLRSKFRNFYLALCVNAISLSLFLGKFPANPRKRSTDVGSTRRDVPEGWIQNAGFHAYHSVVPVH